jgi:hypothetical protein
MQKHYFSHRNRLSLCFLTLIMISAAWGFTQGPNRYSGQIVSIDLTGDIRDFFQGIASVSGFRFDIGPSIERNITIHLKDVPWDLALDTVLKTSGLNAESDGKRLRIAAADPLLGRDHVLMGTMTIEGKVTEFDLQNPRTIIQVRAPGADGDIQSWRVEWESKNDLSQIGLKPNNVHVGDQVIITGNLIRSNTIRLIILRRPSDGFSWGDTNLFSSAPADGVMFVSGSAR